MARISMVVWNEFTNDARVLKEAQTLSSAGHYVSVHALHTPGVTSLRETLQDGISVLRVARSPFWKYRKSTAPGKTNAVAKPAARLGFFSFFLKIVARLWTHFYLLLSMLRAKPDVIHSHDVNTLVTGWAAAKIANARLVYDAHEISTSREGYAGLRKIVGLIERVLMPRADGTITTTDARAKFFARAYHIARPVVLQNRPRQQPILQSNRIREQLGLDRPWPIVLYQGGIQQGRGLERLARLAKDVPDAYFVFIGGGRLDGVLRAIVQEAGVADRVRFISTVALADLPAYTASADIGVQPIENTCFNHFTTDSNKLFEYVQAGLSVVASDLPEIRRVVQEHDLGVLVKPGDSAALAGAIGKLVDDGPLRLHYTENARKASSRLSWESQEHELVKLYDKVLGCVR
ncbi:MAG: glycosyltransferase [Pseudomonas sp.]|nr:glycosyltransferase family 4 protein [Pseudomonas sp.]MPT17400.1 glycosyltransferase [Pseudomonas sp.]